LRLALKLTCMPQPKHAHALDCWLPAHVLPKTQVALSLMMPEVVVVPSTAEMGRQLGRLLRNLVESAKPFVRWMDGTCLEAPEQ